MKKIIYSILLACGALVAACSDSPSTKGNTTITGEVAGLKQGKLYLYQMKDTSFVAIDSLIVNGAKDAKFAFGLDLESPEMLFLTLDRGHTKSKDNQIAFFAEPGNIEVNTTLKHFYADVEVKGSSNQPVYQEYLKTRAALLDVQNALIVDIFKAQKSENTKALDSLQKLDEKLTTRRYLNAINFALTHPSSDVAPYVALTDLYNANTKYLDTIYNSLDTTIASNKYGKQLKEYIAERKEMEKK
ncbi:DUF4369 domain-containing protein [Myroides pelagicus]|uniref:DUF4369 domain-containing protein n=1 Tax=Myroides pelagicus TaxID=270914 RepID=A0A7K1GM13_9FLAO|nr:DUF4369 domain-containing protein [Myroides pelagicus]MTH29876.1 DUF4369 domain-containing protein [Myroides pelagicus]